MAGASLELYDPRNGDLALKIQPLEGSQDFSCPKRTEADSNACRVESASPSIRITPFDPCRAPARVRGRPRASPR